MIRVMTTRIIPGGSGSLDKAAVLEARGLGKRFGSRFALSDCTLRIPAGHVVGLVGPNGAGKTTLLQIAVGLLSATSGTIRVLGRNPDSGPSQLARVGFVAQDTPVYPGLSIADHLRLGRHTNAGWDQSLADDRMARLGLDPSQKAGKLSGGQRAQLALTMAIAKRPDLLILDEPVASLDPLARREFLQGLMAFVTEQGASVILSSHLVSDLERVCDYLVVLVAARVRVAGEVEDLLATHYRVTGARGDAAGLPPSEDVIEDRLTDRQPTLIVRRGSPIEDPMLTIERVTLEDLVLAYMSRAASPSRPALEATR
jgi:ABC-2 type transport system ATP-binding protein